MNKKILGGLVVVVVCVALAYAAATKFTNVWVTGTLQVDGVSTFNGRTVMVGGVQVPIVDVAVSTPAAAGLLAATTNYVLYISSSNISPASWLKVGAQ